MAMDVLCNAAQTRSCEPVTLVLTKRGVLNELCPCISHRRSWPGVQCGGRERAGFFPVSDVRAREQPRVVLAQWENAASSLTLLRGEYPAGFQLLLISKPLTARARSSMQEAIRLDAIEAPRRELDQRKKEVADASAARDKTRTTNKAAFRP